MEGGLDDLMIDRYIQLDFIYYLDSDADHGMGFEVFFKPPTFCPHQVCLCGGE